MKFTMLIKRLYEKSLDGTLYSDLMTRFCNQFFSFFEHLGLHLTPVHYYSPIPEIRTLKRFQWDKESELVGVDFRESQQVALAERLLSYAEECKCFPANREEIKTEYDYYWNNGSFEHMDAFIYYSMIRYFKPQKVIEVGCGFSTRIAAKAALMNLKEASYKTSVIGIDPYPNNILKKGFPGLDELIVNKVENIGVEYFVKSLRENDILFIDSTHVVRIGGDVVFEYLELLPRLPKGVLVHIHDMRIPQEYPRDWVMKAHYFWTEKYLLQAVLQFNSTYEILWAGNYMHLHYRELCQKLYDPCNEDRWWPGSFWIRRII